MFREDIMPKLFECLHSNLDKNEHNHIYLKIGFNDSVSLSNLNVTKFVLNFNEKFILDNIVDQTDIDEVYKYVKNTRANVNKKLNALKKQIEEQGVAALDAYLVTAGIPDPDLIVRTSGESRISNYLLWQGAYSEFLFVDELWPDFRKPQFYAALQSFAKRDRRYGKVK